LEDKTAFARLDYQQRIGVFELEPAP